MWVTKRMFRETFILIGNFWRDPGIATDSVEAQIERLLHETRPNRHTEIKSSDSITVSDVLKKFPRLKNYDGEIV